MLLSSFNPLRRKMVHLLLTTPEALPEKENIGGGELSEYEKGMWKKPFLGTCASVLGESPQLTYRIHRATDYLLEEIEATETPFKLREFPPPEPITRSGIITFNEIRYGGHVFKLMVPIKVEPEPSTEGWILYHEELSILVSPQFNP